MRLATIPRYKLEELVEDSLHLQGLRNAGVDNWDWYDEYERPTDEEIEAAVESLTNVEL